MRALLGCESVLPGLFFKKNEVFQLRFLSNSEQTCSFLGTSPRLLKKYFIQKFFLYTPWDISKINILATSSEIKWRHMFGTQEIVLKMVLLIVCWLWASKCRLGNILHRVWFCWKTFSGLLKLHIELVREAVVCRCSTK